MNQDQCAKATHESGEHIKTVLVSSLLNYGLVLKSVLYLFIPVATESCFSGGAQVVNYPP